MIEIPVYIILPDKIGDLYIEPLKTEQNISHYMEVLSPRKSPLCTAEVLPMSLLECPRMNQNRMSPKELEQNLGTSPPHPIHEYSSGNINTLYVHMHTYPESFIESHIQEFHRIT